MDSTLTLGCSNPDFPIQPEVNVKGETIAHAPPDPKTFQVDWDDTKERAKEKWNTRHKNN